jgi:hypothetical protein
LRAAHLMMHRYGGDAELEAAKYADLTHGCGDRDGLLASAKDLPDDRRDAPDADRPTPLTQTGAVPPV